MCHFRNRLLRMSPSSSSIQQNLPAHETTFSCQADCFRQRMRSRIAQLFNVGEEDGQDDWTDVTFLLEDGSHLDCHQLILKMASPFFEIKFGRRWNRKQLSKPKVKVEGIESETFRLMVEFIYKSGKLTERVLKPEQVWQLLEAADMYLLPGLVTFCNQKLSDHLGDSGDERELVTTVKEARRLPIFEEVTWNLLCDKLELSPIN